MCETLYAMNPNDNLGVRYILVNCYLSLGQTAKVLSICRKCSQDAGSDILYGKVLGLLMKGDPTAAGTAMEDALRYTPNVAKEIAATAHTPFDAKNCHSLARGSREEAAEYWSRTCTLWENTPGAVDFVRQHVGGVKN